LISWFWPSQHPCGRSLSWIRCHVSIYLIKKIKKSHLISVTNKIQLNNIKLKRQKKKKVYVFFFPSLDRLLLRHPTFNHENPNPLSPSKSTITTSLNNTNNKMNWERRRRNYKRNNKKEITRREKMQKNWGKFWIFFPKIKNTSH